MELQKLQQRIIGLLRERDVTHVMIDDDDLVFQANAIPTSIRIRISISDSALVVRGFIPFFVPKSRRPAMAEAICRAVWQLKFAVFEMDWDDGELRCRADIPLFGTDPTDEQINNLIYAVWANCETYCSAFLEVMVANADPALAIVKVEETEEERPQQARNTDLSVN